MVYSISDSNAFNRNSGITSDGEGRRGDLGGVCVGGGGGGLIYHHETTEIMIHTNSHISLQLVATCVHHL